MAEHNSMSIPASTLEKVRLHAAVTGLSEGRVIQDAVNLYLNQKILTGCFDYGLSIDEVHKLMLERATDYIEAHSGKSFWQIADEMDARV